MPHILITNDDGVTAPGLLALAQEIQKINQSQITILAPDRNWSASGHVKTLHRPLRVKSQPLPGGLTAFASDGAPSDCVALALLGYLDKPIDLVVSGINPYANLGHDVTYSGTVTAAMEAVIGGIPGLAFSLNSPEHNSRETDYTPAARAARKIAERVLDEGLPKNTLLNVNVPFLPEAEIKGWQLTRQGLRVYRDRLDSRTDPRGRPYFWIGGEAPTGIPDDGTDFGALAQGYISITPLQLDMTDYRTMATLKGWEK
ncbi:MAG: 5'/3'-nucleotidase SurE [Anaerolineae bacterium]|nr:5'/3'-nucleotidase SurE [Anaerolineae bacterium]